MADEIKTLDSKGVEVADKATVLIEFVVEGIHSPPTEPGKPNLILKAPNGDRFQIHSSYVTVK